MKNTHCVFGCIFFKLHLVRKTQKCVTVYAKAAREKFVYAELDFSIASVNWRS